MLKHLTRYLDFHKLALQNSMRQLLQSPLSTFTTLLVLAITLTLPTLFWTASDTLKHLSSTWNIRGQLTVYFDTALTSDQLNALQAQIHNMEGVADTRFISAEEGLNQLKNQEGMQNVLDDLPENPLPAASVVIPAVHIQKQEDLQRLQTKLQQVKGVDTVKIDVQWIQRMQAILYMIKQIANLIILLLGVAVLLIISNTLRLAIQNQQEEIRILKLIGASDRFILRPFLYAGILYGFFAAVIAILLSNFCLSIVSLSIQAVIRQYEIQWSLTHISAKETLSLLFFAVLLGWLAARISVRKQLQRIEPDI